MRTDSTFLSEEAIKAARDGISEKYGKDYLPPQPRSYAAKKVKGAQEAHEAIRPAGNQFVDPDATGLTGTQFKLYEMIWKRTVASQMVDARQKQVSAKIAVSDAQGEAIAGRQHGIEFPGFCALTSAPVIGGSAKIRLPHLREEPVSCGKTEPASIEQTPGALHGSQLGANHGKRRHWPSFDLCFDHRYDH